LQLSASSSIMRASLPQGDETAVLHGLPAVQIGE
jgi:hypothetical protein